MLKPLDQSSYQAHTLSDKQIMSLLKTSKETGLTLDSAKSRRNHYGENKLREKQKQPLWIKFFSHFRSTVIYLLIIAAALSTIVGEWVESIVILSIVFMNTILSFYQEIKAENAIAMLKKFSAPNAKVLRGGEKCIEPAINLVPGDIIELDAGDHVPADCRLISSYNLKTQEASLTGESEPVHKEADLILRDNTPLAERRNMIYSGTTATSGSATCVVTATGMGSELGKIASLLEEQPREPTPLQLKLAEVGRTLVYICICIVIAVAIFQWSQGHTFVDVLIFSISLGVAAVPEGLPAVVTVALTYGLTRLAKKRALIRALPSVETLGSVTTICSDKTGTLTLNQMTVTRLYTFDRWYHVEGTGYNPSGKIILLNGPPDHDGKIDADAKLLLTTGAICNHAQLYKDDSSWKVIGDPTEGSLIVAAKKAGISILPSSYNIKSELPFDSERKMMSVIVETQDYGRRQYVKGAPENILAKCKYINVNGKIFDINNDHKQKIDEASREMANSAIRVLGLAIKNYSNDDTHNIDEEELTFIGLIGMIDPPRPESIEAVAKCKLAGITPVMITGDHPMTGLAIAKEIGIAKENDIAMTGSDIEGLTEDELIEKLESISVYARVSPEHKLKIVKAWKKASKIVAMTGDGVNDAPAIKAANIGIAMGITGTDVTKEASDLILTDDNFSTIVSAVEEGRGIFTNLQNILRFLLSGNSSEIALIVGAVFFGYPVPLMAMQILWINLITDGLPALALATERPSSNIMNSPPRPVNEPIFTLRRGVLILTHGILLASVSLVAYIWAYEQNNSESTYFAQGIAFNVCALSQLFYSFSCRSRQMTCINLGFFKNPALIFAFVASITLQLIINLVSPFQELFFNEAFKYDFHTWAAILGLAIIPFLLVELSKVFNKNQINHRIKNN